MGIDGSCGVPTHKLDNENVGTEYTDLASGKRMQIRIPMYICIYIYKSTEYGYKYHCSSEVYTVTILIIALQ